MWNRWHRGASLPGAGKQIQTRGQTHSIANTRQRSINLSREVPEIGQGYFVSVNYSRSSSFSIFSSNSCRDWHSTHSFANGTASNRFSLISTPHSAQIPYVPSDNLVSASSIACRRRLRISIKEIPS